MTRFLKQYKTLIGIRKDRRWRSSVFLIHFIKSMSSNEHFFLGRIVEKINNFQIIWLKFTLTMISLEIWLYVGFIMANLLEKTRKYIHLETDWWTVAVRMLLQWYCPTIRIISTVMPVSLIAREPFLDLFHALQDQQWPAFFQNKKLPEGMPGS